MPRNAIVFVHGRGQKPGKGAYHTVWLNALQQRVAPALRASLPGLCSMAYYADVFYEPHSVGAGTREAEKRAVLSALLDRFAGPPTAAAATGPQDSPAQFIEDVLKYFAWDYNGVVAQPVIQELDRAAAEADNVMVISHSMGTMVTYDVLADHPYHIDTWITLGSPLGYTQGLWANTPANLVNLARGRTTVLDILDRTIRGILEQALEKPSTSVGGPKTRLEYPCPTAAYPESATVERWVNVNDPTDPVAALDPRLADDFPDADGSQRAMDVAITNAAKTPGDAMSAHSDPGYLSSWQVGQLVTDFLLRNR